MAIKQTIWSLDDKRELSLSSLVNEEELENLIADNISLLSDDWLVVGRQVRTEFGGIIDLICVDIGGNRIVVELKKSLTPRDVTAQALDYASWVKTIDANKLKEIYLKYSGNEKTLDEAFSTKFGTELSDDNDESDLKIVIVATSMDGSTERIINYLQGYSIDINVLFFNVFEHSGMRLLSRAWMFEPEQIQLSKTASARNWNGEYYFSYGGRSWEDAVEYGFVSAGGGPWYVNTLKYLEVGSRIWVNIPKEGYVGVGIVQDEPRPARETTFLHNEKETTFADLPKKGKWKLDKPPEKEEYIVKVKWVKTVTEKLAISEYGFFGNQNTVCRPKAEKWDSTVKRLKEIWNIKS